MQHKHAHHATIKRRDAIRKSEELIDEGNEIGIIIFWSFRAGDHAESEYMRKETADFGGEVVEEDDQRPTCMLPAFEWAEPIR